MDYNNDYYAHHGAHGMWAQNILITYLREWCLFPLHWPCFKYVKYGEEY